MDVYSALSDQVGGYEPPAEDAEGELNEDGTLRAFGAMHFNGEGQKLALPQTTLLDVTESLTLEAWISPNGIARLRNTVSFIVIAKRYR